MKEFIFIVAFIAVSLNQKAARSARNLRYEE